MVDPILTAVATSLATKTAAGLYDLVKKAFSRHPKAEAALVVAEDAPPESPQVAVLAQTLADVEKADPAFGVALRAEWAKVSTTTQTADHGGVTNQISGTVTGNVVQARDITGGVTF
jgi:hypothetical protein